MRLRTLGVLFAMVCLALPAWAQEQRGSIEGFVRDNTGAVLPGASVEAKAEGRGAISTVSDSTGAYRFPALQPGLYEVTATLQGFTAAKTSVNVGLGSVMRVELQMQVGGLAENVQVTAEQPLVDVKSSQRSFTLNQEKIDAMPRGRDFSTLLATTPGVNMEPRSGGPTFDGASASENRFVMDGIDTANPQTGVQGQNLVLDNVGEFQVKSSGLPAEYGGATGAVVNLVTRTGTNLFRGTGVMYWAGDKTQSDPRQTLRLMPTDSTQAEYITYPEDKFNRFDVGGLLGGPILRDRLWFFGSYIPSLQNTERTANLSNGTPVTREEDDTFQNVAANVSAQLGNSASAKFNFNNAAQTLDGVLPAQNGSSAPTTIFDVTRKRPRRTLSGNFDYVASQRLYLGARGGYALRDEYTEGIPGGSRFVFSRSNINQAGVPAQFQQVSGFASQPTTQAVDANKYGRTWVQGDVTYYADFGGRHTFKGGVQLERITNEVLSGETWGNLIRIQWGIPLSGVGGGTYGHYQVRSNGVLPDQGFLTQGNIANNNIGLFIQDDWTIGNRLTLNLGLRTENERVPSYTTADGVSDVAVKWGFGDKLAPRVGFSLDVMGDGRTKVWGSYSVYYDVFKMELPRGAFGGDKWLEYYYTLDTFDWTTLDPAGCPPACPGTLLRGPVDFRHPSNDAIDPNIEPMRSSEATLGFERDLGRSMLFSARYMHKQLDQAVEDIGSLEIVGNVATETYVIGNPGQGIANAAFPGVPFPKFQRDYDAVEFALDKRFANNWSARTSYTWSRLYGNYAGLSQSDENGRTSPNVGRSFDYPIMAFDGAGKPVYGRLATDRPHQFKAQVTYMFPFGTSVAGNFWALSGVPVTREAAVLPTSNYPVQYRGRLSDGRTPTFTQTDLMLAHDIKFGGSNRRLRLEANIINLFDQKTALNRFSSQLAGATGLSFDEADFYAGSVNFDQLINNLGNPALFQDPRFLKDNSYQDQRLARIAVRFFF